MFLSLLVMLAAVAPAPAAPGASRLVFIGDSVGSVIDVGADRHDSVPGRQLQAAPALVDLVAGDTLVVELGSNNLASPADWSVVDQLLAAVPAGVRVLWVSPYNGWDPAATDAFGVYLAATGVEVVPWGQAAQPFHTHDGVHPTPLGAWLLAALIAHSLNPTPLG